MTPHTPDFIRFNSPESQTINQGEVKISTFFFFCKRTLALISERNNI